MPFTPYTLPISLNAVATGGGVTSKSMSGLRGKTVYDSGGTSYTTPSSGPFSLKDNFLNRSFTSPATVPDAPTEVTVQFISFTSDYRRTLSITWKAPTNDGGSAILDYTIRTTINSDGIEYTTPDNTRSITITSGPPYSNGFIVTARNSVGSSSPSLFSVADAPTNVRAIPDDAKATVYWDLPINTGYGYFLNVTFIITANPGGLTMTAPYTTAAYFNGLTNGTAYTFTVISVNPSGNSAPSSPSDPVTPPQNNIVFRNPFGAQAPVTATLSVDKKTVTIKPLGGNFSIGATLGEGNNVPIYISFDFISGPNTLNLGLNNQYWNNINKFNVYFPYGLVNGTISFYSALGGINGNCYAYITNTKKFPSEPTFCQNASGNSITCP
jgi:hypothetical protein